MSSMSIEAPATTVRSPGDAEVAFDALCVWLDTLDPRSRVRTVELFRRRLDAIDARTLAAGVVHPTLKGGGRGASRIAGEAGVSTAECRRRVRRAKAVAENPALADKLADGTLSSEHVDAVARAAQRTDGAAARDQGLLERVAAVTADQAAKVADDWVHQHLTAAQVQSEHDRQRRLRHARRSTTPDGLASITLAGDRASIDVAWAHIESAADAGYRADGGRDVPADRHPRSPSQRFFDAAIGSLTDEPEVSRPGGRSRPTVVVTATLDAIAGTDGARPAELIGTGPIAATVLVAYRCHADLVGLVFGTDGRPLWCGRAVRTVTPAQWTALVARDRGCVLCGAPPSRGEAHHLIPWNAPARGGTDIDNLALLCGGCHRHLHERQLTLIRGPDHIWTTRPATPAESPPPRPPAYPSRAP